MYMFIGWIIIIIQSFNTVQVKPQQCKARLKKGSILNSPSNWLLLSSSSWYAGQCFNQWDSDVGLDISPNCVSANADMSRSACEKKQKFIPRASDLDYLTDGSRPAKIFTDLRLFILFLSRNPMPLFLWSSCMMWCCRWNGTGNTVELFILHSSSRIQMGYRLILRNARKKNHYNFISVRPLKKTFNKQKLSKLAIRQRKISNNINHSKQTSFLKMYKPLHRITSPVFLSCFANYKTIEQKDVRVPQGV